MRRLPRLAVLVGVVGTGALAATACATAPRTDRLKSHMIRRAPDTEVHAPAEPPPGDSFEAVISKIRHLAAAARPAGAKQSGATIESTDPALAAALAALQIMPTAAAHRQVAGEYVRLRLLDVAYDHYRRATVLDREDGAAYDGLARIWRDWGLAHLGLGDAQRAVYFAPWSAEAHNTLGTLLQALGQRTKARAAYERAQALDPGAAYAANNLCYLAFVDGRTSRAIELCQRAAALDPSLAAARRNLATRPTAASTSPNGSSSPSIAGRSRTTTSVLSDSRGAIIHPHWPRSKSRAMPGPPRRAPAIRPPRFGTVPGLVGFQEECSNGDDWRVGPSTPDRAQHARNSGAETGSRHAAGAQGAAFLG
jgi:tetratricopeptide (TPR) repeat protein